MLRNASILILLLNCLYYFCQPLTPSHETFSGVSGETCTIKDNIPHGYGTLGTLFGAGLRLKRDADGEKRRGLKKRAGNGNLASLARDTTDTISNTQPNILPRAKTDQQVVATKPRVKPNREPVVEVPRRRKEPSTPAEPEEEAQVLPSTSRVYTGSTGKQVVAPRPIGRTDRVSTDVSLRREESSRPAKPVRDQTRQGDPTGMPRTLKTAQRVPSTPVKPERPRTSRLPESSRPPEKRKETRPLESNGSVVQKGTRGESKTLRRREQSVAPVNQKVIPPNRLQNGASQGPLQIQNELLAQLPPRHKFMQLRRSDPSENLRNKFKQHASAIDLPKTKQPWGGISPVESYKRVERYYKSKDGKVAVWIVRQKGDDKRLFIRKDMEYNPENQHDNDCVHEVNAFQRLHNSNPPCRFIVRAYAWDTRPTSDNRVRIVMEKHSGLHLNNYIIESKGLPEPMARFITKQIILGVNYLHSHGIIWRDLKGDNILMVESKDGKIDGRIVFSDFGYAHLCENGTNTEDCTNTDFAGTDSYMAPEIVENLAAYEKWQTTGNPPEHLTEHSYAVDWWSLGIVLHFMIYFSVPFDGLFPYTTENIHLYKPRFPKNVKVSKELAGEDAKNRSMLQLLLEADPVKRWNGCKNLLKHSWITQVSEFENYVLKDLEEPEPNLTLYKDFAEWSGKQKSAFEIALDERQQKEATHLKNKAARKPKPAAKDVADLNNQIDDLLADFNQGENSTEQLEFDDAVNNDLAADIMQQLKPRVKKVRLPRIDPLDGRP